jgi:tRNA A-37 threonylcarbamoyl transferase component Bud32
MIALGWMEVLLVLVLLGGFGVALIVILAVVLGRRGRASRPVASPQPPAAESAHVTATDAPAPLCPRCGAGLAADAPEGLCPACLMKAGMPTGVPLTAAAGPAAPADPPADPRDLATRFPQLEIIEVLGRGGMGVVYKARQPRLDRLVALKILPASLAATPGFAERFEREARALARLSHPNIVAVYDFGQADGLFYLLMEYVDGSNLRQLIEAKAIAPAQALAIVPKICEALQFAHDEGILHRDIKPENILIDRKGRVKIADFGLAKLSGEAVPDVTLTHPGMVMGTPRYMAPEQVENAKTVDHRADIYSLGVVFYEMLTGELPLGRFAPPSEKAQVDGRLDAVVFKTLEKEPDRRYQHASEVKTAVEGLPYDAAPAPAHPPLAAAAAPVPRRGLGILSLIAAIAGLVLPVLLALSGGLLLGLLCVGMKLVVLASLLLFAALELVALGCGIAARRTGAGKAGLIVSAISLSLPIVVIPVVWGAWSVRAAPAQEFRSREVAFGPGDRPLAANLAEQDGAWVADCAEAQTLRLYEVPDPGMSGVTVIYSAEVRTGNAHGPVYLEMWCRLPGMGEFFSRGLDQAVTGTTEGWMSMQIPFFLKPGQAPDLIKLNVVAGGPGRVAVRNVRLSARRP